MRTNTLILFVYSTLVTLGGVMGYLKGGSIISLIAGGGSGVILFILSYFSKKPSIQYAALIMIFLLDALFTYRFAKTLNFFPSGLFSLISIATIALITFNLKNTRKCKIK